MYSPLILALGAVVLTSAVSLIGVVALSMRHTVLEKGLFLLISLSAGALFGDALIHLIPEAFEELGDPTAAGLYVLSGILLFFVLEKFLHWHHTHHLSESEPCSKEDELRLEGGRVKPLGALVLASDGVHNFLDGAIIAASFLVNPAVGIASTIAIILHEIPQEIGDFGLLLHAGFSRARALLVNFLSALAAIAGALFVFVAGSAANSLIPIMLAFAAGGFLYVAGSDLVPELHTTKDPKKSLVQFLMLVVGILLMASLTLIES